MARTKTVSSARELGLAQGVGSNSGLKAAYVGGYYGDDANYGFFYLNAHNDASNTSYLIGSRLIYIPQ